MVCTELHLTRPTILNHPVGAYLEGNGHLAFVNYANKAAVQASLNVTAIVSQLSAGNCVAMNQMV